MVSEPIKPFGQWVTSRLCFSVHFVVALLNAWCLLFVFGTYSACCVSMSHRDLIGVVITCLFPWCLLFHEFQCLVMSYQIGHLYNLWSVMRRHGKLLGIQRIQTMYDYINQISTTHCINTRFILISLMPIVDDSNQNSK